MPMSWRWACGGRFARRPAVRACACAAGLSELADGHAAWDHPSSSILRTTRPEGPPWPPFLRPGKDLRAAARTGCGLTRPVACIADRQSSAVKGTETADERYRRHTDTSQAKVEQPRSTSILLNATTRRRILIGVLICFHMARTRLRVMMRAHQRGACGVPPSPHIAETRRPKAPRPPPEGPSAGITTEPEDREARSSSSDRRPLAAS